MPKASAFGKKLFDLFETLNRIEFAVQTNGRASDITIRIREKTPQREGQAA